MRYAIEAALGSVLISDLVLTSNDQDILKIGTEYDELICIDRPEEISGDNALAITYVQHTLIELGNQYEIIVIVQPSSPLTSSQDIDGTIQLLLQCEKADSAVSVVKLDHAIHPFKMKYMEGNELQPFIVEENGRMASHELPDIYVRNCSVYVSKISVIRDRRIIGEPCVGYIMSRERSLDINDEMDWMFAEWLVERKNLG